MNIFIALVCVFLGIAIASYGISHLPPISLHPLLIVAVVATGLIGLVAGIAVFFWLHP